MFVNKIILKLPSHLQIKDSATLKLVSTINSKKQLEHNSFLQVSNLLIDLSETLNDKLDSAINQNIQDTNGNYENIKDLLNKRYVKLKERHNNTRTNSSRA